MERAPMLLNATQAAELLGISPQTFRRWTREPDFTARPVTRSGSSRQWWRTAEIAKLAAPQETL